MTKQYPTKQYLNEVISNREFAEGVPPEIVIVMARQLLAGMEQEPVAWMTTRDGDGTFPRLHLEEAAADCWVNTCNVAPPIAKHPLYAAPQLPQPAVVEKAITQHFDTIALDTAKMVMCDVNRRDEFLGGDIQLLSRIQCRIDEACRAAMLHGSEPVHDVDSTNRQFESLGCAEDTARRFKCTGLIVTSDERKMELPRCSKHPETELQVHPFEQLLSYPPQPVMYCPLCRPSVAKWVEFDNQLRQWKGVK